MAVIQIAAKMPKATKLATFEELQENKSQIRAGAKAITLLKPGREYSREDGRSGTAFSVKNVFGIYQTIAVPQKTETHGRESRRGQHHARLHEQELG